MNNLNQALIFIVGVTLAFNASSNHASQSENSKQGQVDTFYVGADNACDFSNIQGAINAANNSSNPVEIFVAANKTYTENLLIDHNNMHIDGLYTDCTQARLGILGQIKANNIGGVNGQTLHITGQNVSLKNMIISNNEDGGILANGTSNIILENINFSQLGYDDKNGQDIIGAIQLMGSGEIDLQVKGVDFSSNISFSGSAIYCNGSAHSIDITDSVFSNNQARQYGGALFVDGCDLTLTASMFQNNSALFGGGIYALLSNITLSNMTFEGNSVNGSGGALTASESVINAEKVLFVDNQSQSYGGAISLSETDLILSNNPSNCPINNKCNHFNNNHAGFSGGAIASELGSISISTTYFENNQSPETGGAITLASGAIDISTSYFENNRADNGTAVYLIDDSALFGTTAKIEGSVFINNGNEGEGDFQDRNVLYVGDNSTATITYSTFADNNIILSTFKQDFGSELNVYSSIISEALNDDVFDPIENVTRSVNCLIVHEITSIGSFDNEVIVADPIFIDRANGDYHINPVLSPAVDYCTDTLAMAQYQDIDGEDRGFDDPDMTNNFTDAIYDIGADEAQGDLIFANGFE